MGRKEKALADILSAIDPKDKEEQDVSAGSLRDLINAVLREPNAKKRQKMLRDFASRHAEIAAFLEENQHLLNAEAEAALIGAAVGGTYTDTEISYKGGKKRVKTKKRSVQPNVAALNLYLKNRMPDKYSDKPQTDIEIEDVSEMEAEIYGGENS